jgi:Bacteriophage head to tail connecting protein
LTTPIEQQRWWTLPKEDAHGALFQTVRRIATQNAGRRTDDTIFMRMYGARDVIGRGEEGGTDPRRHLRTRANGLETLKTNLVRSVVNTAAAHIASKRPAARFQTDDADWALVNKAQACEQAVKGIFYQNDVYGLGEEGFKDASIASLGALYVYSGNGRVKIERVMPTEILVDVRDGYYGHPRTLYRVKLVDRLIVKEAFGLKDLPEATTDRQLIKLFDWLPWDSQLDQVVVVAGWRLGNDDDEAPAGKHIVACQGKTLDLRDWNRQRFPFSFFRWEKRQAGFHGCGIVEELRGHQRSLNYLDARIADAMHIASRTNLVTFQLAGGKKSVNVHHIDNNPSTIIDVKGGGQAPQQLVVNAVPTEWFQRRREIMEDGYAQIGVSQLQATGQVPMGIKSGVAIREVQDAGSKRWQCKSQAYEQWLGVDTAKLVIDELREMAERGEVKPIPVKRRRGSLAKVEMIDWSKVALEDHEYTLEVSPASSLPDTTAGRKQTVEDWAQAGKITGPQALALSQSPDLERYLGLALASYEVILDTIDRIVEKGEYYPPEPTDDLELAVSLVTESYNKFRLRRLPPDRLDLLLEYLDDLRAMGEAAQAQAQPQAQPQSPEQAPPGATQAGPMPVQPAAGGASPGVPQAALAAA